MFYVFYLQNYVFNIYAMKYMILLYCYCWLSNSY